MESDRIKWNQRFSSMEIYLGALPSPFLQKEIERIKRLAPGKRALDIACGEGRNSIFLAEHSFCVDALDISDVGISKGEKMAQRKGLNINFKQIDLDSYKIEKQYDLILNFNFLQRELIPHEINALVPDGLLLFDTILESEQLLQEHRNDYLLRRGELFKIFKAFDGETLFSEESDEGDMPTARVLFKKSS